MDYKKGMRIDPEKHITHRELELPIKQFTDPVEFHFTEDQIVEDVLEYLRTKTKKKTVDYIYITNKENRLLGVLALTDLIYNLPNTPLLDILNPEVVKVYEEESLERGLHLLSSHQILILPVVNKENQFTGILEVVHHEEENFKSKKIHVKNLKADIFQFIGFSIEQRKWRSPWMEYKLRMPWLLCNLVGGLICAVISDFFELTLVRFVLLAFFIPLVLTLSESISIQSMTLSLRFLHLKKVHWGQVWRRIFRESRSSVLLGLTSAVIIGAFYFAWSTEILPMIGICVSIVSAMVITSLFGALFPIVLHVLHLDPKVAAGPVVLMISDILTIAIYLGLNTLLLNPK